MKNIGMKTYSFSFKAVLDFVGSVVFLTASDGGFETNVALISRSEDICFNEVLVLFID